MEVLNAIAEPPLWQSLTWVDSLVLIVVLLGVAAGLLSGFIWQVIRLICVLGAFWVAAEYHEAAALHLGEVGSAPARLALAYVVIFVGLLTAGHLVLAVLRGPVNALKPEAPDRLLGGLFGMAKGVLICGALALGVLAYGNQEAGLGQAVRDSRMARLSARMVATLYAPVARDK